MDVLPAAVQTSPDGAHTARFVYAGEVRFGPPYFRVELNGRVLRRRLRTRYFGDPCLWSADSRYLALQEWYEIVEHPDTELRVIDVIRRRECRVARVRRGFVEPVRFEDDILVFSTTSIDDTGFKTRKEDRICMAELRW